MLISSMHKHGLSPVMSTALSESRCNLISMVALSAYIISIFGVINNAALLALACASVLLAWPILVRHQVSVIFMVALVILVLQGAYSNGVVASLRSAVPYLAMLVGWGLTRQRVEHVQSSRGGGLAVLYIAGIVQIICYVVRSLISPDYHLFVSLNEFNRYSVGWIAIICFFISALPGRVMRGLPVSWRRIGAVFWLVPILVALNSSRSELLMTVALLCVAIYVRSKLLLGCIVLAAAAVLPSVTGSITGVERSARSIEEVFDRDIYSLSDVYTNYRAFENLLMIDRIFANGPLGCGLGCSVSTPVTLVLNDERYDEIAVFHNGFLTLILHLGVVGFVFVMILVGVVYKHFLKFNRCVGAKRCAHDDHAFVPAIRFSVLFLLLGTSFTTGGFMSSYDALVLLLPLACALNLKGKSTGFQFRGRKQGNVS